MKNRYKNSALKGFLICLLICVVLPVSAYEPEVIQITGVVKDSEGKALANVEVMVDNKFAYTLTKKDGTFSLEIPREDDMALLFVCLYYEPQRIEVEQSAEITVVMPFVGERKEYNVGYATRDRNWVATAISTVTADDLHRTSSPSLPLALIGSASGLTVMRSSGSEPGRESFDMYVRGVGTYGLIRSPLCLVDDVESDFSQLDIEEVESVSVLKDGAANAQYGQRGANGTILVKTKRGYVGKPEIMLNAQFGMIQATRLPAFLGAKDYMTLYNQALSNDGMPIPDDMRYNPETYTAGRNEYMYPDVDWYGAMLRTATPQQQYKLSVRGGTDVVRYYVMFGFLDQQGLYKHTNLNPEFSTNTGFTRYSVRSNLDASISRTLSLSLDLSGRIEDRNMPNSTSSDIFGLLSTIAPNAMPVLYPDGKIAGTSQYQQNPYGMITQTGYRTDRNKALRVKAEAKWNVDFITKGLSVKASVAYDAASGYGSGRSQKYAAYEWLGDDNYGVYGEDRQLSLSQEKFYDYYQYLLGFNAGVFYDRSFGKHHVLADARYYQQQIYKQKDNPAFARQGINGKVAYNYDNRYVAEFSFAWDGSDEYAPGHRFGFFPGVAGAWIISNEAFFPKRGLVSYLKLRASYGVTGNNQTGLDRYGYMSHWHGFDASYGGYIFGNGFNWSDGAWEGRSANPELTWESSRNMNIGVDFELLRSLSVSVDAYRHDRCNIVSELSNTSSVVIGAPFPYVNIGSVLNQGVELSVSHQNKIGDVGYFASANVSFARNRITDMDEVSGLKDYQSRIGKSVTQMWGLEVLGFYADEADIRNSAVSTFYKVKPGDLKYKNQNPDEDNHINTYDEIPIGSPTVPEWTFGLSLGVDYKGFDLTAVFNGVAGRSVYLSNAAIWSLTGNNKATALAFGAWERGREAEATYPRLTTENNLNNYRPSSFWIKSGSFLRMGNLELGYSLPARLLSKAYIKQLRVYVNAQNLFTLDKLGVYNLDPEVVDAGVTGYPVTRTFNVGLKIKF